MPGRLRDAGRVTVENDRERKAVQQRRGGGAEQASVICEFDVPRPVVPVLDSSIELLLV